MSLEDLIGPIVAGLFVMALLAEWWAPRDEMRAVRGWRWQALGFFVLIAAMNLVLPLLLPLEWLVAHSLLPGQQLGVAAGVAVGWVAWSFVYYWVHRAQHRVPLLWRGLHQLHHAALRVDIAGFTILHPFEVLFTGLVSQLLLLGVLGLHPLAVACVGLATVIAAMVQHLNVRTPRWLGWFVQRPEAHLRHHEYGEHAGNYADWPLWDRLFGTYREPPAAPLRYGFDEAASRRYGAMLLGIDVNPGRPPVAAERPARP